MLVFILISNQKTHWIFLCLQTLHSDNNLLFFSFFFTFISVKENLISHSNTLRTNVLTNQVDFIKIVKC